MKRVTSLVFAMALSTGAALSVAEAKPKCPTEGIICTTQYDPVICLDGKVYSNACFATANCAVGCVPYNG
jgi:hypothetical protein